MQGWEKLMNGRLKGRLDNWVKTLSSKEIDADVLRKMLSNNKEYSTPTQYNNAFSYLTSLGYIIHDDEIEVVKDYVPEENIESEDEFFSNDDEKEELEDIDVDLFNELISVDAEQEDIVDKETEKFDEKQIPSSILSIYLHDIDNHNTSILTREEEIELMQKIREGDEDAYNEMVYHNLRLVLKIARSYYRSSNTGASLDLMDLIQEGNIGLIEALNRFDVSLGYKFSTYATWWIKQKIMRAIHNNSRTIRIPIHLIQYIMTIKRIMLNYETEFGEEPSYQYVADYINENKLCKHIRTPSTAEKVKKALYYWQDQTTVSLSVPVGEDEDSTLGEFIPSMDLTPEQNAEKGFLKEYLIKGLDENLKERDAYIIKMRFGFNSENKVYTQMELAEKLGFSYQRVQQIESRAYKKLAKSKFGKMIKKYLKDN